MPGLQAMMLTEKQVRLHARALRAIAWSIETGKPIRAQGGRVSIPPTKALYNLANWVERQLAEQNGGKRVFTAWDYQEEGR